MLRPLPAISVFLLVLLAILPWGGPAWFEPALALLSLGAIYFWSLRRPRLMPALVVFGLGLLLDVLTHGPLGVWAAAALIAGLAGRLARQSRVHPGRLRNFMFLVLTLFLAATLVAIVTSLARWQWPPWRSVGEAVAAAACAYPVLAALLSVVDGFWPVVDGRPLFARGD